mgnify:CR=1 FL=1
MESIQDKINKLDSKQRKIYREELIGICEFRDFCISYGAKDPVNLPKDDIKMIKQNLYREMFESKNIKPF